ncbi:hypothetical protein IMX26_13250 [Clostridium sp. 'deep sea']|uniref:hypothetical protein n=1 Tax=Clostridium sp. 'deep sea' TaxID=2779445 RepID=UPI00189691FD|nr:hypothetical protein [Clostridium sp. 'deep sea']QOR34448.1 hypothetical protein IMX26_13250 [Clostridium sp. 'deep sea']
MLKIIENEILIGTDDNAYVHYGFVTKKDVSVEGSVIKVKSLEFSLENKQYEVNVSDNSVIGYVLNDTNKIGEFTEGVFTVDTTNLTDIKLELEGVIKYLKTENDTWVEYTPEPPKSEIDKLKNQVDQLALAILTI